MKDSVKAAYKQLCQGPYITKRWEVLQNVKKGSVYGVV